MTNCFMRIILNIFLAWSLFVQCALMACYTPSNFAAVRVSHMSVILDIDMDAMKIDGYVDLTLMRPRASQELILDAMALSIQEVWITPNKEGKDFRSARWKLEEAQSIDNQILTIYLEETSALVRIMYSTTEKSGADWVPASLTKDKIAEFGASHARTFVPCQDSPTNKITFNADIKLFSLNPDPRLAVRMQAAEQKTIGFRHYQFTLLNEIPSSLISFKAGLFTKTQTSPGVF